MKTVVILSGGLDSTVLAYKLARDGDDLLCLTFDYGQRHRKEINAAQLTAQDLGFPWRSVDLTSLGHLLKGNALSDSDVCVPEGHYADATMQKTVVPNRNAVMLACAFAVAAARGYERVALGVHGGDHFIYPDCRPEFIQAFEQMERQALGEWWSVGLYAPFVNLTKVDIVKLGTGLQVPFADTWSCYNGGELHCGVCGTCVERKEAFMLARVPDPTPYAG